MDEQRIAIVFDYDGTLIDTMKIKAASYLNAFESVFNTPYKLKDKILASQKRTAGAHRFIQLSDTLGILGLTATDEEKEKWSTIYSSLNEKTLVKVQLFPSVQKTLNYLKERGFQLFAVSGIPEHEFLPELSRKKLMRFFIEAKGGDKPAFLTSLKQRGFRIILFVGDTSYDQKAAADAGVLFFRVNSDEDIRALLSYIENLAKDCPNTTASR